MDTQQIDTAIGGCVLCGRFGKDAHGPGDSLPDDAAGRFLPISTRTEYHCLSSRWRLEDLAPGTDRRFRRLFVSLQSKWLRLRCAVPLRLLYQMPRCFGGKSSGLPQKIGGDAKPAWRHSLSP